jgi:para-aminobenzoate synthetase/4-amino-4-deoxychorismate lyase
MAAVPDPAPSPSADLRRPRRPNPDMGVFETLLVIDGRPIELDAHLARLEASLAELFPGEEPPSLDGASVSGGLGALRITVAPGDDGTLGASIEWREAPSPGEVSLHSLTLAGGLGTHKWADRSLLDEAQAKLPDEALPLIIDEDGSVLEVSRANLFAVRRGILTTPVADGRILPGITRMRVLEIAAAAELEAQEAELRHDDLLAADEVFLTGSVRGIEPVGAIDGTRLEARSEVGRRIAADLRRSWMAKRRSA